MTSATTNKPINFLCAVCNLPIEDFELANAQWRAEGPFEREDALFVHKGKCSHDTRDTMPYWECLDYYLEGEGEYPIFPADVIALLDAEKPKQPTITVKPEPITATRDTKFDDCCADKWHTYFASRSEAIQSVLVSLARKFDCDEDVIRIKFERTPLCEAWEADGGKWTRLSEKEIARAITFAKAHPQTKTMASTPVVEYESPVMATTKLPRFEPEKAESDYVDMLADELTKGTAIPFNFGRETLKMLLLAGHPQLPELEFNSQVHGRQYVILLSETAGSGKGESYRRVTEVLRETNWNDGADHNFLYEFKYREVMGSQIGSPEHAVLEFGGCFLADPKDKKSDGKITASHGGLPNLMCNIAYYDEGKKLLIKDSAGRMSSGLVEMFISIFEANRYGTGSRRNGRAVLERANVSMMLHFVRDSFDQAFADSGAGDDGFLSRCTIIDDHKNMVVGDWRVADQKRVQELMSHITHCMTSRNEIRFTPEGSRARLEAVETIRSWEPKTAARLEMLFCQDVLARAVFSAAEEAIADEDVFAAPGTRAIVDEGIIERAFAWTENQYHTRQATWPLDVARDKYERMSRVLMAALEKHRQISSSDLAKFAHVNRPGSGGYPVFDRVLRSLPVEIVGRNRKGTPVYSLR
jgi:hypothetical protein